MRGIVMLAIVGAIAYGGYNYYTKHSGIVIADQETEDGYVVTTIAHGGVEAEVTELGEFEIELRVFGASSNLPKQGPFLLMTDLLFATPLNLANSVFSRYLCEKVAVNQASHIQLIIQDEFNRNELDKFKSMENTRKCAYLAGTSYRMDDFYIDGQRVTISASGGNPNADPYKIILVRDLEMIPCS